MLITYAKCKSFSCLTNINITLLTGMKYILSEVINTLLAKWHLNMLLSLCHCRKHVKNNWIP